MMKKVFIVCAVTFFVIGIYALSGAQSCIVTGEGSLQDGSTFAGSAELDAIGNVSGSWEHLTSCSSQTVCEGLSSASFGLCNAYCDSMDCASDTPKASDVACDKIYEKIVQITGDEPPCESCREHFTCQIDSLECQQDGLAVAVMHGTATRNGESGYECVIAIQDLGAPSLADDYFMSVVDSGGIFVYFVNAVLASGDTVVNVQ